MLKFKITSKNKTVLKFKNLWCKEVSGFTPYLHGAGCLRGTYIRNFNLQMTTNHIFMEDLPEGALVYFCGMPSNGLIMSQLHLAGVIKKGALVKVKLHNGDILTVANFQKIDITPRGAQQRFPKAPRAAKFCKCFHFGAKMFTGFYRIKN
jgi:hypothetical protein